MNNIGLLIKMSRIQQNMKQITLAKGICSTSYLSKIENNQTVPSEEVLNLLLSRLNLDYQDLSTDEEAKFLRDLFSLYKEGIIERKKEVVEKGLSNFTDKNLLFKDEKNFYTYNLFLIRFYIITDSNKILSLQLINALSQMESKFDEKQKFIYNLNKGLLHYLNHEYKLTLESLEKSLNFMSNFHLEKWELADFYNILSLAYLANNQLLNTIEYATKSLSLYKDSLLFERAFDCYIVIGISHKKNLNFDQAQDSFLLAQKISKDLNLTKFENIIFHNLGGLYALQGESQKAIELFKKSLINSIQIEERLITIFSIVNEFSKQDSIEEMLYWTDTGLELIDENKKENYLSLYHHFMVYKFKNKTSLDAEVILEKAIQYYESIDDFNHAYKYSILLGNMFSIQRKYKKSTLMLQKSNSYLYKIKSINFWEDL